MKKIIIASLIIATQFTFCVDFLIAQEITDSTSKVKFNQVISNDDFNKSGLSDPLLILTGQAVGVSFTKKGSDPNVFNSVIIRGTSSEFSSSILYIIDGVYGASPEMILPDDVESFEILKDGASLAKYGRQGSAGVIIIKTKRFKGDKKLSIKFNSFIALNSMAKRLDLLSASQYRSIINQNGISGFVDGGASTDWQDEIFRTTVSQTYNLELAGKLNNTGYQFSVFHRDNPGIVLGSDSKNMGLNLHLTQSALNNHLNLRASAFATKQNCNILPSYSSQSAGRNSFFYQAFTRNPTDPIFENDGTTYYQSLRYFNYYNPIPIIKYTTNTNEAKNLNLNFGANYKVMEGLDFDLNMGYILFNTDTKYHQALEAYSGNRVEVTSVSTSDISSLNLEAGLNYSKSIRRNHHLNIRLGYTNRQLEDKYHAHYISSGGESTSKQNLDFNSIVGEFEYNFKQRYFFTTLVNNEYSKFLVNRPDLPIGIEPIKNSHLFPAVTVGWKLSNESFMNQHSFINNLTIKGGYGLTGNVQGEFLLFSTSLNRPDSLEDEKTQEVSIGIDFGLWKNRVNGSINYYQRNTKNAITLIPLPVPPNPYPSTYGNGAWFKNKGFEITVNALPIVTERLKWSTSITYFKNSNELVSSKSILSNGNQTGLVSYSGSNFTQLERIGSPSTVFYLPVSAGNSSTGNPLFYTATGGLTSNVSLAKKEIIGQPVPKFELGWANSIHFLHGFDLSIALRYVGGYNIYNATRMVLSNGSLLPSLNVSQEGADNNTQDLGTATLSDKYLENASFLRLENITLSYTLRPKNLKWGDNMKIYLSSNNLFTITKYSGFDPAGYSDGIDFFNVYPLARSFVFGIRLTL